MECVLWGERSLFMHFSIKVTPCSHFPPTHPSLALLRMLKLYHLIGCVVLLRMLIEAALVSGNEITVPCEGECPLMLLTSLKQSFKRHASCMCEGECPPTLITCM